MMRRALVSVICLALVTAAVSLPFLPGERASFVPIDTAVPPGAPEPAGPRRIPITGAAGLVLVIEPDGASHVEAADGTVTPLTTADLPVVTEPAPALLPAVKPKGRLVVCPSGAVEVPADSLVTHIGDNVVVAVTGAGTALAFYSDGRVERRDRRRPLASSSSQAKD